MMEFVASGFIRVYQAAAASAQGETDNCKCHCIALFSAKKNPLKLAFLFDFN